MSKPTGPRCPFCGDEGPKDPRSDGGYHCPACGSYVGVEEMNLGREAGR